MKVNISKKEYSIEADEILEKKAVKFGKTSSHIILPLSWKDHNVVLIVKSIVKQWTQGYLKKGKPTTWKKVREIEDAELEKIEAELK